MAKGLGLAVTGSIYFVLFLFWLRLVARPINDITQSVRSFMEVGSGAYKPAGMDAAGEVSELGDAPVDHDNDEAHQRRKRS